MRDLVCIGVLAHIGLDNAVVSHTKRALRLGATKQEVMEAIETTLVPGRGATFATGLAALMKRGNSPPFEKGRGGGIL
jgi:alkylhydroperoxidase/carboxymuconolactone decarboxylase family protein YurZ